MQSKPNHQHKISESKSRDQEITGYIGPYWDTRWYGDGSDTYETNHLLNGAWMKTHWRWRAPEA